MNRIFIIALLFVSLVCTAQEVSLSFDGNISNPESAYDPTFIVFQDATDISEIEYVAGVEDQAVYLDIADGFNFPMELTNAMMASNLWSFQMRFKITSWGAGDGDRMLINLKRGGTNTPPWFEVKANKSDETEEGRIIFRMSDGSTGVQQYAFYFNLDEWVNLSLVVDFAANNFILSGDSFYVSANYENFDVEKFKTFGSDVGNGLQDKQFFVGYYHGLKGNHLSTDPRYNVNYSANLIIDQLKISADAPATDVAVYENALVNLTAHLNEEITLTESEISTYVALALNNFNGNYLEAKDIVNAYFEAYETHKDTLWLATTNVKVYEYYDEFGQLLFNLQQDVHDNYFTNEHVNEVAGLSFAAAHGFPGRVLDSAERLTNETVTINGTYKADLGYNKKILEDDYGAFARRPTGLYAAPGELVTVTLPNELVGIGADVVVGSFTHDVSNKISDNLNRFPRVIKEYEIISSTMTVANPFGGIIYIYIPEGTDLGIIDISISGALKFAYFPMTSFKTGDIDEFHALIDSEVTLWAEVETDNFMFTAPLANFRNYDIVPTLEMWDKMWAAYQLYNGRPYPLHKAEHYIIDRKNKWNTLAGGYPMTMGSNNVPNTSDFWAGVLGTNMMNILDFDAVIHDDKATYWHEMSHHTALPTMANELECIVEVAYVAVHNVGWGMPLDSAMKYSERGFRTRNDAIVDWVIMPGFRTNQEMTKVERQYQMRGYSKYVDIAARFGWEGLGSINKVFYDQWTAMGGQVNDPEKNIITDSEWHLASAYALNQNVSPLYHFWGEQPDSSILDSLNTYPRSKEAYLRLREIRDFIPKTTEEFQPYYDRHAPADNKTTDQNWKPYRDALSGWNSNLLYDSIIAQIDSVLFRYYDGDFDEDGFTFYEDCDDTDPAIHPETIWYADSDEDGLGDLSVTLSQCEQPEGYVLDNTDCNDADSAISSTIIWYQDADGDGYGYVENSLSQCEQPEGYVLDSSDCDDADGGLTPTTNWYEDGDNDGLGDPNVTLTQCEQPEGYVLDSTDCNDADDSISSTIIWYADLDGDGLGDLNATLSQCDQPEGYVLDNTDCDDTDELNGCANPLSSDLGELDIKIYPNPSDGTIWIEGEATNRTYKLQSITGQVLQNGKLTKTIQLPAESGLYLMTISDVDGNKYTMKIFRN